jgi:hypothetical protein
MNPMVRSWSPQEGAGGRAAPLVALLGVGPGPGRARQVKEGVEACQTMEYPPR